MSHRTSPSRAHVLSFAILPVLMLTVLVGCSSSTDSAQPDTTDSQVAETNDRSADESASADPDRAPDEGLVTAEDDSVAGNQPDSDGVGEETAATEDESSSESSEEIAASDNEGVADPPSEFSDGEATAESSSESADELQAGATEASTIDEPASDEIPDSQTEASSSEGASSEDTSTSDDAETLSDGDGDRAWNLIQNRGRLRIGLDPSIGYTYLQTNADGMALEGFEWDILQAIAEELSVELEPVYIPWDRQLEALETDSVDAIFGGRDALGMDESRYLATVPYYASPQRIVVRDEFSEEIQHLSDLFGRKVGTVADSAGAAVVEVFNRDRANALTLQSSPNPSRLFEQLRRSEVDAIVIDQPVAVAEATFIEGDVRSDAGSAERDDSPDSSQTPEPPAGGDSENETNPDSATTLDADSVASASISNPDGEDIELSDSNALGDGESPVEEAPSEAISDDESLRIVGEPMFPTPLVGVVKADNASIAQALDRALATLEQNGTITAILEKWEL